MANPNRAQRSKPSEAVALAHQLARSCQRDHMRSRGWSDTGQHFTVTRDGVLLEGRVGSLAAAERGLVVPGAHCRGRNADWWGIECEGTYHLEAAWTDAQWRALVWLTGFLMQRSEATLQLRGHREFSSTACPGLLLGELPRLRSEAEALT
jgi:hypothetical protein